MAHFGSQISFQSLLGFEELEDRGGFESLGLVAAEILQGLKPLLCVRTAS